MTILHQRPTPPPMGTMPKPGFRWDVFLLRCCAAFHGGLAFTLAAAPVEQVYNAGTQPVFAIAPRYVWAILFAFAGLAAFCLTRNRDPRVQLATWLSVFPLGAAWLAAFALAVTHGHGSAISIIVWPALYVPWAVVAVRIGLGKK